MKEISATCKQNGPFTAASLNEEEISLIDSMINRVDTLVEIAHKLDVRLMIDAEHSYFQPAIDNIVLQLQRKYNHPSIRSEPLIFNTFQCYLKHSHEKILDHIARADREGWQFACKMVRGAYMVLERKRASQLGYPSPIHDTIDDTHANFNQCVREIINRDTVLKNKSKVNMLVASHNQKSVELVLKEMEKGGIDRSTGGVYFGQLLGMADNLTFPLGAYVTNIYSQYQFILHKQYM